ncbi:hypothetical protein [Alphabaculovirus myunipunctae]|uniref:AC117 n=1 Tax=Mythimna unipuncta nucleopolyhedrovirus TaxID=447897 RepID=A0A2K9VS76_9ABAC|nr:hypothetical protein [Mythimna unipuncta nucleopolyhedrovirus]AUV65319.1 hypothetical protein [Mythimna unipuncta nucleopolyhedrovirus]
MKLITFVMSITNRSNLEQDAIYETYLRHFDVIDAVMCLSGDCLAVCVSAADPSNRPRSFVEFQCQKRHLLNIVDTHDDAQVLLDRMYDIVEEYNANIYQDVR